MGQNEKPFIHGAIVVLALMVFFPVGIVLIIARLIKHRNVTHLKILDRKLCAHLLLIVFLMMSIVFLSTMSSDDQGGTLPAFFVCIVIFLLPSLYLYFRAYQLKRMMHVRFERYLSMIYTERLTSIAQMAANVQCDLAVVVHELQHMVFWNKLPGVFVDAALGQVVSLQNGMQNGVQNVMQNGMQNGMQNVMQNVPNVQSVTQSFVTITEYLVTDKDKEKDEAAAAAESPPVPKTVECTNCGVKILLQPGESRKCEYCHTAVSYA